MKLSRHTVRIIVALIVCALMGMTYLQYRLLMNTIALKETTFSHNVTAALNFAAEKLEEIDARNRFFHTADTVHAGHRVRGTADSTIVIAAFNTLPHAGTGAVPATATVRRTRQSNAPQRVTVRAYNMLGRLDTTIIDTFDRRTPEQITLPKKKFSSGVYFVQMNTDSATSTVRLESGRESYAYTVNVQDARSKKVINRIAETIGTVSRVPLAQRYTRELVDSVLATSLAKQGVDLPFEYALFSNDTMVVTRTTRTPDELLHSPFRLALMPLEPVPARESMAVLFPGYRAHMLSAYLPELGASIVLICIIVICFASTIAIIVRQNHFARRLSDFINNMTHEFKTPLSTISLAAEAIAKPEIRGSESKVERYNQIIIAEHARMRRQVDKILEMAALEDHETEFDRLPFDVRRVVERAAEQCALAVRSRNGSVSASLGTDEAIILGDALHVENVLCNLLDNAVKYSPEAPAIAICVSSDLHQVQVSIADRGIGIAREHHARIFEKYFRVPTGNLHDVKGFGMGLSYVKLVTEKHGGTITIESEPGRGTTVTLRFPCASINHRDRPST